jgi:hypothetical protein
MLDVVYFVWKFFVLSNGVLGFVALYSWRLLLQATGIRCEFCSYNISFTVTFQLLDTILEFVSYLKM